MSLKSMEVTDSYVCCEVLIVPGVSILNYSVFMKAFKVLSAKMSLLVPVVGFEY